MIAQFTAYFSYKSIKFSVQYLINSIIKFMSTEHFNLFSIKQIIKSNSFI